MSRGTSGRPPSNPQRFPAVLAAMIAYRRTRAHEAGCKFARNSGSDAVLVVAMSLGGADHTGLKEVEFTSAVHLAFDELELGDLAFGLAVRPR